MFKIRVVFATMVVGLMLTGCSNVITSKNNVPLAVNAPTPYQHVPLKSWEIVQTKMKQSYMKVSLPNYIPFTVTQMAAEISTPKGHSPDTALNMMFENLATRRVVSIVVTPYNPKYSYPNSKKVTLPNGTAAQLGWDSTQTELTFPFNGIYYTLNSHIEISDGHTKPDLNSQQLLKIASSITRT